MNIVYTCHENTFIIYIYLIFSIDNNDYCAEFRYIGIEK